jgi:plastocyanin
LKRLLTLPAVIAAIFAVPALATTKTTSLKDDYFPAGKITVHKGTTVVWSWNTDDKHTVTEINGKWGSKMTKNGRFKHTFKKKGRFTVYCLVHPTIMRQKVVVK